MSSLFGKAALLVCGGVLILGIYALNPDNRVYSYHGFVHAAIAYDIANHGAPPSHPFLAGQPLLYHWGYHSLAAALTLLLGMTPFYAFALINSVAFVVALLLAYEISRRVFASPGANILPAYLALCGATLISPRLLNDSRIGRLFPLEWSGVPVFEKFSNSNGLPLGVVFFLLFLYALLNILQKGCSLRNAVTLGLSIIGCGFFYAPMLLGLLGSLPAVAIALVLLNGKATISKSVRTVLFLAGITAVSLLLLLPYLRSVSAGFEERMDFFEAQKMGAPAVMYAVLALPYIGILAVAWRRLAREANRDGLIMLLSVILANGLLYISLAQPSGTQRKYLVLSLVSLGILTGGALYLIRTWGRGLVLWTIVCLSATTPVYETILKVSRRYPAVTRITYIERGKDFLAADREEEGLYSWIRTKTPKESVFIDSSTLIPIFGQRRLFISTNKHVPYGAFNIYNYLFVRDKSLLAERRRLAAQIYSQRGHLTAWARKTLAGISQQPVFVIDRKSSFSPETIPDQWKIEFRSATGAVSAYRFSGNPHPE